MSSFVLVRSTADVARACEDLTELLLLRRRQDPTLLPEFLLGMWIDARSVEDIPTSLDIPTPDGAIQPVPILESTSLSAAWALCWLRDGQVSRQDLVEALQGASPVQTPGEGLFIPVFRQGTSAAELRAEQSALRQRFGQRVMAPLHQHPVSGRLAKPTENLWIKGTLGA